MLRVVPAIMFLALLVGCTASDSAPESSDAAESVSEGEFEDDDKASPTVAKKAAVGGAGGQEDVASPRKIIYNAEVELRVESVAEADKKVQSLVKELKGYVAKSQTFGSPEEGRSALWVLRIPVARFDGALGRLQKVGEARRVSRDSKDVTAQYVDVETRLRNKKAQEERLREILKKATTLADTLKLEQEMTRVRSDIESWQGQLNVLKNQVDLATIEVSASEDRTAFGAVFAGAFGDILGESFRVTVQSSRALVIFFAAVTPWLVPGFVLLVVLVRWRRRRQAQHQPDPPQMDAPPPTPTEERKAA